MRAQEVIKELRRQAIPEIVIALIGNNTDMAGIRTVEYDVRHYIEYNAIHYYTSCKGGTTIF